MTDKLNAIQHECIELRSNAATHYALSADLEERLRESKSVQSQEEPLPWPWPCMTQTIYDHEPKPNLNLNLDPDLAPDPDPDPDLNDPYIKLIKFVK